MEEILNDPSFTLTFSNTKSVKRVSKLIDSIKTSFQQEIQPMDDAPFQALAEIEQHPEKLLIEKGILEYENEKSEAAKSIPGLPSLRVFMVPAVPPSDPRIKYDPEFEKIKYSFLSDARTEHQRLLYSFQDRLTRDLLGSEDPLMQPPFRVATQQIAKSTHLPIGLVQDEKPKTIQEQFEILSDDIQHTTSRVIQTQLTNAKMITDRQTFENAYIKNPPVLSPEEWSDIVPVSCPYSFLSEGSTSA